MKDIGVDSLRFSIPYMVYGRDFKQVKHYRNNNEIPFGSHCEETVKPYLSKIHDLYPEKFVGYFEAYGKLIENN